MESWENEQPGNLLSVWLIRRTWKSQQQVFILQNPKLFPSVTLSHAGRGKVAWIIVSYTGKNRHFHLWNWSRKFSLFNHMILKDIFVLTNHSSPLKLTLDNDLTSNFKLQNLFWPQDWSLAFALCPKWQYNKNCEQFVKKKIECNSYVFPSTWLEWRELHDTPFYLSTCAVGDIWTLALAKHVKT